MNTCTQQFHNLDLSTVEIERALKRGIVSIIANINNGLILLVMNKSRHVMQQQEIVKT